MFRAVGIGAAAAATAGILVGVWAAIAKAPPEVAGGVASGLGGAFGLLAFGATAAVQAFRKSRGLELWRRFAGPLA